VALVVSSLKGRGSLVGRPSLLAIVGLRPVVGDENHALVRPATWLRSRWCGPTLKGCFGDPRPALLSVNTSQ
jgi:hypothetical protein